MKKKTPNEADAFLCVMRHYVTLTPDGLYHIQNVVGAFPGQHHVHSEQGYLKWKKNINNKYIHEESAEFCLCGLEAGYVKEYDGRVWLNEDYQ